MPGRRSLPAAHALLLASTLGCGERPPVPPGAGSDSRQVTTVPLEVREAVRSEMRTMLGSLHGILMASLTGDTAAMRQAAVRSGLATAADPALEKLLPEEFLQLGMGTHRQFDELAAGIASGFPRDTVVARLARLTGNCVACHESHRLESR
jgi:hypothetical protein